LRVSLSLEHSADSSADCQAVWHRYTDVEHWSEWSRHGVEWSRVTGPFEVGTTGKSKPPGARALEFELVAVEPGKFFVSEVKLPGARLRFKHSVMPNEQGCRITHRIELDGPLAFAYWPIVRKRSEQGLEDGVDRLAATT
jgi:hypothetical protein